MNKQGVPLGVKLPIRVRTLLSKVHGSLNFSTYVADFRA
jgi:hypothetical protein